MTRKLNFSMPHLLRDEVEYDLAVSAMNQLLDDGSERHEGEIRFLALLVEHYDQQHYAIEEEMTPQEAVDYLLEAHGMTRAQLAEPFGGRSRVSDFFAGRRDLSKAQILYLHRDLGVPLELLFTQLQTA